jgi:hypothetical protein
MVLGIENVMNDTEISKSEQFYLDQKPSLALLDSKLDILAQNPREVSQDEIKQLIIDIKNDIKEQSFITQ